jgi:hypothetical protein
VRFGNCSAEHGARTERSRGKPPSAAVEPEDAEPQPGVAGPASTGDDRVVTPEQLVDALRRKNPGFDEANIAMRPISADLLEMAINDPAVKDISPLKKQRIAKLDLRFCDLTDLRPLEGMPISELYLEENKRLSDLTPLRGMPCTNCTCPTRRSKICRRCAALR